MMVLLGVLTRLTDLCVAAGVAAALALTLPLLTLLVSTLRYLRARGGARKEGKAEESSPRRPGDVAELLLFTVKGVVLWALLLQADALVGSCGAAWACALVLERATRARDASLLLIIEPTPGALDFVFLLGVAPLLCAPAAGGAHGVGAAWHAYLCVAFFWRSAASAPRAVALSFAAHFLASSIGLFGWRRVVSVTGLAAAEDESAAEAALLVIGVGLLLLIPPSTRVTLCPIALAFSPTFQRRAVAAVTGTFALWR